MMVKNSRSALLALAAAGGLWAWRNRDMIQGWLNSQNSQLSSSQPMTGETRRIGQDEYLNRNTPTQLPTDTFQSEV
jgi:hypothetical protein